MALAADLRHAPPTMIPSFNTAGPCIPGQHYMLPPEKRFRRVVRLVDEGKYFVLRAGRQTGKSTSARWLERQLNAGERYASVWVDIQTANGQPDPVKAFRELLLELDRSFARDLPQLERPDRAAREQMLQSPASALLEYLSRVCAISPCPLVVLFDEADCLVEEAMVSFLSQLRRGYLSRADTPFPHSLGLIGQRDVRDFALSIEDRRAVSWLGTSSPFNIAAETTTLDPFTRDDVEELLAQHTEHTTQRFEPGAVERIWDLSRGHPWLVNAIADQIVNRDVEDRKVAITAEHVEVAKETLIVQRRSHIDSLLARLRESRVRQIMEPMLAGGWVSQDVLNDDFAYVAGLGLIALRSGVWEVANPIYREIVVRELTFVQQTQLRYETAWYVRLDGSLDLLKLLVAWQKFWRKDGHLAAAGFHYREAGPHLVMMAFLQRVINGGGRIEREYGLGRGALDLLVEWREHRHAIELKIRRDTETEDEALEQIDRYLDSAGLDEGWLVLFDMREGLTWQDKIYVRDVPLGDKTIHVVGC